MGLIAARAPVVVDASFLLDGIAGDARVLDSLAAWTAEGRTLLAPPLLWLEVANALLRRRRETRSAVVDALRVLRALGVETADRGEFGIDDAVDLAAQYGLTVYDASYLQLALDIDGELATRDRQLIEAAKAEDLALADAT